MRWREAIILKKQVWSDEVAKCIRIGNLSDSASVNQELWIYDEPWAKSGDLIYSTNSATNVEWALRYVWCILNAVISRPCINPTLLFMTACMLYVQSMYHSYSYNASYRDEDTVTVPVIRWSWWNRRYSSLCFIARMKFSGLKCKCETAGNNTRRRTARSWWGAKSGETFKGKVLKAVWFKIRAVHRTLTPTNIHKFRYRTFPLRPRDSRPVNSGTCRGLN